MPSMEKTAEGCGRVCVKEDSSWIEFLHVKHGE